MEQTQNQQKTTDKCACSKPLKSLEKKIDTLEKGMNDIMRQIEILKKALRGKGV